MAWCSMDLILILIPSFLETLKILPRSFLGHFMTETWIEQTYEWDNDATQGISPRNDGKVIPNMAADVMEAMVIARGAWLKQD